MVAPAERASEYARIYRPVAAALSNRANILCLVIFLCASVSVIGSYKTNPPYVTLCGVLAAAGSACAGFKGASRPQPRGDSVDMESGLLPEHRTREPSYAGNRMRMDPGAEMGECAGDREAEPTIMSTGNAALSQFDLDRSLERPARRLILQTPEADITETSRSEAPISVEWLGLRSMRKARVLGQRSALRKRHFHCPVCSRGFTWRSSLKEHMKRHRYENETECPEPGCSVRFHTREALHLHKERMHDMPPGYLRAQREQQPGGELVVRYDGTSLHITRC